MSKSKKRVIEKVIIEVTHRKSHDTVSNELGKKINPAKKTEKRKKKKRK